MNINLALVLSVLTAISGLVVALDKWYFAGRRQESAAPGILIEYSRSFFPVLLFVLVIRSFVFEPFRIPSGSMMPTLLQGDYIFVKKYSYGLRWPVIEKKFIDTGEPARGDVIVFRLPLDPSINYIKRVIGLPGDEIVYSNHRLTVNGKPVALRPDTAADGDMPRFIESLGQRDHAILVANPRNTVRDGRYVVPEGSYFVMGDNRDNSRDSRFIGAVPESYLVGEAVRIWMHMDGLEWPEWGRIGMKIQ